MRRLALVAMVAAIPALVLTFQGGTAVGHSFNGATHFEDVTVTPDGPYFHGQKVTISGKLVSGLRQCFAGQTVKLRHVRTGFDKVITVTTTTDAKGVFTFVRHPHHDITEFLRYKGFNKQSYGHSHRCQPAESTSFDLDVRP